MVPKLMCVLIKYFLLCVNKFTWLALVKNHTCFLKIDLSKYASKLTSVYFPTPVLVCLEMTASKCPAW